MVIQRNNKFIFIKQDIQVIVDVDIPFTNGELNTKIAFIKMNVDEIEYEGILVFKKS